MRGRERTGQVARSASMAASGWMRVLPYGLGVAELSFPVPPLDDEVVSLRPWRETDVPANLMAFGDPVVQRFLAPALG